MRERKTEEDRVSSLVWGAGLVLIGTVVLLQYFDVIQGHWYRTWWPAFVIAAGLGQLVSARTARRVGNGTSTLLIGGWLWVTVNHYWGLDWHNSWPLAIVASGMGMVVGSLASFVMDRGSRSSSGTIDV